MVTHKEKKRFEIKGKAAEWINMLFQSFLVTYLLLLLIEQIWTGTVSFYINLNWLLVIVIIFGILDVFSVHEEKHIKTPIRKRDYIFIVLLGIIGFAIIKFKTESLGWLSWLISSVAGVLIILLSILVLEDEDEQKTETHKHITHKHKQELFALHTILIVLILALVSVALTFFTQLTTLESFRIVFGSVYVLFLPGFIISYIFFPKSKPFDSDEEHDKGSIDFIERIALSFALSIAIVPLAVFYLNLAGLKISLLNSFLTILGIIVLSILVLIVKHRRTKSQREKERVFETLKFKNRS